MTCWHFVACALLMLFSSATAAAPSSATVTRGVTWDARHLLKADIYRPTAKGPHPGILLIHGGGWGAGAREELEWFGQNLASSGFVAVSIDYRLIMTNAVNPRDQFSDVKSALGAMTANARTFDIDPARLAVLGGSAGGHLAAMLATEPGTPLRAAVILWGPTDLTIPMAQLTPNGASIFRNYMKSAETAHISPAGLSPLFRVTPKGCKAWLLIHGEMDELVPVTQSRVMHKRLLLSGLESHYLELPGQQHFPRDPEMQRKAGEAILMFLHARLGK